MKTLKTTDVIVYGLLVILAGFCLIPVLWMVSTSLKPTEETFLLPPKWLPLRPSLDSYFNVWQIQSFARYFWNSIVVAVNTTIFSMILAMSAGYGFSRFRMPGSGSMMTLTLISQMFPGVLLVIPYFLVMSRLELYNTYPALFIAYTSFALPFCIWMLKGFMDSIPKELDEAAMVDGCGRIGAFVRVVVPLALPGIGATALFSFMTAWNEFLFALALTSTPDMYVVTMGIVSNIGQFRVSWNDLMAAAVLASIPTILVYIFLERYLVEGLTAGAVKG